MGDGTSHVVADDSAGVCMDVNPDSRPFMTFICKRSSIGLNFFAIARR